jgi:hypothetical protein
VAITSIKTGSSFTNLVKYNDFLAGNAAFNPSSYESIASATGTGSSGTITFSSIPATYKHLQIRAIMRTDRANTDSALRIRFNSDSGSNYAWHWLYGDGSSAAATGAASQTSGFVGTAAGGTATANLIGVSIVDIQDYASSTKNKTVRAFAGIDANNVFTGYSNLFSSLWLNTNAITSIDLVVSDGSNWTTQSVFSLYGIK